MYTRLSNRSETSSTSSSMSPIALRFRLSVCSPGRQGHVSIDCIQMSIHHRAEGTNGRTINVPSDIGEGYALPPGIINCLPRFLLVTPLSAPPLVHPNAGTYLEHIIIED
jgi:hypothetical protein